MSYQSAPFPSNRPLSRVLIQQFGQQAATFPRNARREAQLVHEDQFEQDVVIAVVKWQSSAHHLVHDNTQTPPVNGSPVVVIFQHLRETEAFVSIVI